MKISVAGTLAALLICGGAAFGQNPPERTRLYTKPDPASTGGIKGRITQPELPIEQILATPAEDPEQVYDGDISGAKHDAFEFKNLPVGKYDLIVIYDLAFYEGLQLSREPSTLTADDIASIGASIQKSEPFFLKKFVHRVEGKTGAGSEARSICTYFRDQGSALMMEHYQGKSGRSDFRRTYKLVILKNVGPGWQIVRARDLYPVWADPQHGLPVHHYSASLKGIRVADEVKDLGGLDLGH